eukprot:jgi/Ulvmu1/5261/UM022_0055.1
MTDNASPAELSADLRAALNLPTGAPPPWQARLVAFGIPIDYRSIEPEPESLQQVEQAVPLIETHLSTNTQPGVSINEHITGTEAFRVRLGPKYAPLFSGHQHIAASHTSPDATTALQTWYPDSAHAFGLKTELQTRGAGVQQGRENPQPAMQARPRADAPGSGGDTAYSAPALAHDASLRSDNGQLAHMVTPQQLFTDGAAPPDPGRPPHHSSSTLPIDQTPRMRGSAGPPHTYMKQRQKRSHAEHQRRSPESSRKRSRGTADASPRPRSQTVRGVMRQEHPIDSIDRPAPDDTASCDPRRRSQKQSHRVRHHPGRSPGQGMPQLEPAGDDDVVYVGMKQKGVHAVMNLISDDEEEDHAHADDLFAYRARYAPPSGGEVLPSVAAALPTVETVRHDGTGPDGAGAWNESAAAAPQLQTFTQTEDVSPAPPAATAAMSSILNRVSFANSHQDRPAGTGRGDVGQDAGAGPIIETVEGADDYREGEAALGPRKERSEQEEARRDSHTRANHSYDLKEEGRSIQRRRHSSEKRSSTHSTHKLKNAHEPAAQGAMQEGATRRPSHKNHRHDRSSHSRERRHTDHGERGCARTSPSERRDRLRKHDSKHDRSPRKPRRRSRSPTEPDPRDMDQRSRKHSHMEPRSAVRGSSSGKKRDIQKSPATGSRAAAAAKPCRDPSPAGKPVRVKTEGGKSPHARRRRVSPDAARGDHDRTAEQHPGDADARVSSAKQKGSDPSNGDGHSKRKPDKVTDSNKQDRHKVGNWADGEDLRAQLNRRGSLRGHSADGKEVGEHELAHGNFRANSAVARGGGPNASEQDMQGGFLPRRPGRLGQRQPGSPARGHASVGQFLQRRNSASVPAAQNDTARRADVAHESMRGAGDGAGFRFRSESAPEQSGPGSHPAAAGRFLPRHQSTPVQHTMASIASAAVGQPVPSSKAQDNRTQLSLTVSQPPEQQLSTQQAAAAAERVREGPKDPGVAGARGGSRHDLKAGPRQDAVPSKTAAVVRHLEPIGEDDVWWTPDPDSTRRAGFMSPIEYPGINAPLKGLDTFQCKSQWMQAEILPVQLTNTLIRGRYHARVKLFFAQSL